MNQHRPASRQSKPCSQIGFTNCCRVPWNSSSSFSSRHSGVTSRRVCERFRSIFCFSLNRSRSPLIISARIIAFLQQCALRSQDFAICRIEYIEFENPDRCGSAFSPHLVRNISCLFNAIFDTQTPGCAVRIAVKRLS